jgi:ribosome-associated protein
VNHKITIPFSELNFETSRSGGPGGQNVNKVETRVRLVWDITHTTCLTPHQHAILMKNRLIQDRLDSEGVLSLVCDTHRTQKLNREEVLKRLYEIINKALQPKKKRVATRPTKASVRRRKEEKERRSIVKQMRKISTTA